MEGTIPADIVGYGGWLTALIVVAHVAVRIFAPYADPVLLPLVAALNGLGLAVIHRLDLDNTAQCVDNDTFARQQLIWMTLGVVLFVATLGLLRDHRLLQRLTYTTGLAAIVLLLLPMFPIIGNTVNGAKIWISVGPFSFQPGEVAKVLLVIAFAGYLVLHRDALALAGRRVLFIDLPRGRDLGPILGMWAVSLVILVFQRDLGSSPAVLRDLPDHALRRHRATGLAGGGHGPVRRRGVRRLAGLRPRPEPRQHLARPDGLLRPDPRLGPAGRGPVRDGAGAVSSAVASARVRPAASPTPSPTSSSPAIGEELGLTAVLAVILCYGLIVERALRIALISRDGFGKLMAVGLGSVFALQVFVVIGGVTG